MNKTSTNSIVASRLRLAREKSGLSQAQVAKKLGLHRPAISEIEAGRRKVSPDELVQLADIYKVDVEWLTSGDTASDEDKAKRELIARKLSHLDEDTLDNILNLLATLSS